MTAPVKEISERTGKRGEKMGAPQASASGRLPDVTTFSDEELAVLAASAQAELSARHQQRRAEFLDRIREQARALGLDPREVAAALNRRGERRSATDRRATVVPKYCNPANPSETWAGRGVKPKWLQQLLAAGKTLEELRVQATPATP